MLPVGHVIPAWKIAAGTLYDIEESGKRWREVGRTVGLGGGKLEGRAKKRKPQERTRSRETDLLPSWKKQEKKKEHGRTKLESRGKRTRRPF